MKLLTTVILVIAVCIVSVTYLAVRSSLPVLDGTVSIAGLTAPVMVERDALGVPTVRGTNRLDVARATGFLHGQDRFFQMDLLRRVAAGELSALVGINAIELDKSRRQHRFRAAAKDLVANLTIAEQELIAAYAEGVNAGLQALRAAPFEYILLRARTQPWRPEDTVLVNFAMYFQLNDSDASRDDDYATLHNGLPSPLREFVLNEGTEWDAPLVGDALPVPPVPGPGVCDLRTELTRHYVRGQTPRYLSVAEERVAGSNAWAVGARRSSTGRAIVANDMHLDLGIPNIWYRMRLIVEDPADADARLDITGVTLPGAPAVVAGSNGSVAWGFTNSRGDWSDLVSLELDPDNPNAYLTSDGYRPFDIYAETIDVRRSPSVPISIRATIWGPVVGEDSQGRLRALHWLAHEPEASNLRITELERARDVHEAIRIAHTVGAPPQNIMLADSDGNIAWTIMGRIPLRVGYDPRLPSSWADGQTGWRGWLQSDDYPVVLNPDADAIWTANARVVQGAELDLIGNGGYSLGARASQIRDGLLRLDRATLADMLAIQLDDRALLHERWRALLLNVLDPRSLTGNPRRAELRAEVVRWNGRADPETAGFRLVREFRQRTGDELLSGIVSGCGNFDELVMLQRRSQSEGPIWRLVTEQPAHLLPPFFPTWQDFFLSAADKTIATCGNGSLVDCTWGQINRAEITHPLANAIPILAPWLTVHSGPLPGGDHTPRLQRGDHGASERFAVSPGDEAQGYFHMPGGQSGHPLSAFYRAGHEAWVRGEPQPFLPGETAHRLRMNPIE
jgi:penicillin amidase